jgi:uncharacterized protein YjbI with pentapeptide repeats
VVQGYTDPRWPGERSFRIAHEALITQIREYGAEGTERNRARQLLNQGYHLWLKGGRSDVDVLPEQHFDEVQKHIEDMVLRSAEERRFYTLCLETHNAGWMESVLKQRRTNLLRRVELTVLPALLVGLGFLLGQVPVDFISLRIARVHALTSLGVSRVALAGQQLPGADFTGLSLRGADLTEANLESAVLAGTNLERAHLVRTSLVRADLTEAQLAGSVIEDAQLMGAVFRRADLRAASVASVTRGADFSGAIFDRQTTWPEGRPALGALGPEGRAGEVEAPDSTLAGLDLSGLSAPEANLAGSNLRGARLTGADLTDANLSGSDLSGSQLLGTSLGRARFNHSSLADAVLVGSSLDGADLRWANIRGTNLRQTESLSTARLEGAIADERTQWPTGVKPAAQGVLVLRAGADIGAVNLAGRDLRELAAPRVQLQGADLTGADLQWADLREADLQNADLRRADLRRARLDRANLCGALLTDALVGDTTLSGTTMCETTQLPAGLHKSDVR